MAFSELNSNKALVVFSGGQDSTTCLYWAIEKYGAGNVSSITFKYGQKHDIELEAAKKICDFSGVEFDLIEVPNVLRSSSPLIDRNIEMDKYESISEFKEGVQPTFVPGRNILFLTIAANIAAHRCAQNIIIGVCEEDFGGYYDCRNDFIVAMQKALNQGVFGCDAEPGFKIHTPLMFLNKAQTVKLASDLGEQCMQALSYSHTCYEGKNPPCGKCHACHLRARGFKEAGIDDPLLAQKF